MGNLNKDQVEYVYNHVQKMQFSTLFENLKGNKDRAKAEKAIKKTIQNRYGFGTREMTADEVKTMMAEIKEAVAELK